MGVALSFVPEDRLGMGLVGNMDLSDNMMLRSFRKGHGILTDRKAPRKLAETVVEELDVNTPGVTTPVRRLSGGNVQKVLVGREIASAPTVLLTAYAVRGLDINASYTIYDLINRQKERGVAVIYVGEDLDVLLELCRPHPRALRRQGQRHRPRPRRDQARRRHDDDAVWEGTKPMHNKVREPLFHIVKRDTLPWYQAWGIRGDRHRAGAAVCARSSPRCAPTCNPHQGVRHHVQRRLRLAAQDLDPGAESRHPAVHLAGRDARVQDALLEHRRRGPGARRRPRRRGVHDLPRRQGAQLACSSCSS